MAKIRGKNYDWASVTISGPQGVMFDVEEINYDDASETRMSYGKGRQARGYSKSNYKAQGNLKMLREEYDRMQERMKEMYSAAPVVITVNYREGDKEVTDTLESVVFDKRKSGGKQDDASILVELDFTVLGQILFDGVAPFKE